MKIISYKRYAESSFHIHAGASSTCYYIPDENTIIGIEQVGTFGSNNYFLTDKEEILKEARNIAEGRSINEKDIHISCIKEFECDSSILKELINNLRSRKELEEKVKSGIEELINQEKLTLS